MGGAVARFEAFEVRTSLGNGLTVAPYDGDDNREQRVGFVTPSIPTVGLGVFEATGIKGESGLNALGDAHFAVAIGDACRDELVDAQVLPLDLIAAGCGLHVGARGLVVAEADVLLQFCCNPRDDESLVGITDGAQLTRSGLELSGEVGFQSGLG